MKNNYMCVRACALACTRVCERDERDERGKGREVEREAGERERGKVGDRERELVN